LKSATHQVFDTVHSRPGKEEHQADSAEIAYIPTQTNPVTSLDTGPFAAETEEALEEMDDVLTSTRTRNGRRAERAGAGLRNRSGSPPDS